MRVNSLQIVGNLYYKRGTAMLILSLIMLGFITLFLFLTKRNGLSINLLGMSVALIIMYIGVIIYIAKMGDFKGGERIFMFIFVGLEKFLKQLSWTLSTIGLFVAVGRTLFPFFLIKVAFEITTIPIVRRNRRLLSIIFLIPTILLLIYYYPSIFKSIVEGKFWLLQSMIYVARAYIIIYLLLAFVIIGYEYMTMTFKILRKSTKYVLLGAFGMSALFSTYAIQDPAQIYNFYIYEYIDLNSLMYIKPSIISYGYIVFGFLSILFIVAGIMGISGYVIGDVLEDRTSKKLSKNFKTRSMGVVIFSHSIKNQLLASRILIKKIRKGYKNVDNKYIDDYLNQLNSYNESMLSDMNLYYKTLSTKKMFLKPVRLKELIKKLKYGFTQKFGTDNLVVDDIGVKGLILADVNQIAIAILNIMDNGFEVSLKPILLKVDDEKLYYVISVTDKGCGISRSDYKKIFEPFISMKCDGNGWGLGLYFAHFIIKKHHGYIKIQSKLDYGTTFFIMLPKYLER